MFIEDLRHRKSLGVHQRFASGSYFVRRDLISFIGVTSSWLRQRLVGFIVVSIRRCSRTAVGSCSVFITILLSVDVYTDLILEGETVVPCSIKRNEPGSKLALFYRASLGRDDQQACA